MRSLSQQLGIFIAGSLLAMLTYHFADRAIVFWEASHHTQQYILLKAFTHLSDGFIAFVFVAYLCLFLRFYLQTWSYHDKALLALANSFVITLFLKDTLKLIFGRYWPSTWIQDNPSLIRDGVYGFNWFHSGEAYASFPSGHTAVTAAVMTIIWIAYPRLRGFAALAVLCMAIGQVGMYYHFLSDVIAGGTLGYLTAYAVATMSGFATASVNPSHRFG